MIIASACFFILSADALSEESPNVRNTFFIFYSSKI
jgi:hypothetical protein